jgi:hypothetical protein
MCVAQFRDYCNAHAHKHKEQITSNDEIQSKRGTYYGNKKVWYYIKDKKKMESLAKSGNQYAIIDLGNEDVST